jgi:hypothetical protein
LASRVSFISSEFVKVIASLMDTVIVYERLLDSTIESYAQKWVETEVMPIAIITSIVSIGGRWQSVGGQLLASGVLLASGHQDIGLRARIGATFWFFMAIAFGISALATAIWAKGWVGAALCVVVLSFESWLIRRWWSRGSSA